MIEFNNVGLKFGDTRIIEDLSFSIKRGEFSVFWGLLDAENLLPLGLLEIY